MITTVLLHLLNYFYCSANNISFFLSGISKNKVFYAAELFLHKVARSTHMRDIFVFTDVTWFLILVRALARTTRACL